MKRLGYTRYVAQGGDWGAPSPAPWRARLRTGLLGIHINLPAAVPAEIAALLADRRACAGRTFVKERAAFHALSIFYKKYRAYAAMMGTRPQTIGYALTDSPAGLAAWMFDFTMDATAAAIR